MTEAGWKETDSEAFARLGEIFTPGREEIEGVILDHIPAERDELFLVVDIGCGSGWLGAEVLREFPNARLLALDGSEEMLRHAGEYLAEFEERVGLRTFRLEDPEWMAGIEDDVRCFISSLVIHHLDGAGKRDLFSGIFERLEPGGAFLYADIVEEKSEFGRRHMARAWNEEVERRSLELTGDDRAHRFFVDEGWNMYEHPDPMDKPSGTAEQLRWLEAAGYSGVDVPWAKAGHAVFCGYKLASPAGSGESGGIRFGSRERREAGNHGAEAPMEADGDSSGGEAEVSWGSKTGEPRLPVFGAKRPPEGTSP